MAFDSVAMRNHTYFINIFLLRCLLKEAVLMNQHLFFQRFLSF